MATQQTAKGSHWSKWLSPFFPSWRFFEGIGDEPELRWRGSVQEAELSEQPWTVAFPLAPTMRSWKRLLLNAESNARYMNCSWLERWVFSPENASLQKEVLRAVECEIASDSRFSRSKRWVWEAEVRMGNELYIQIPPRVQIREEQ